MQSPAKHSIPSPWEILTAWLTLGIQSFGGGSSTFFLIHQVCISRGWLDEEEFVRTWALAQISPGINLLKMTVLVGYRLCGWRGVVAGVTGLLLPSAGATVLMTAGFAFIRNQPVVKAAMKGILPAAIGLSLAMGVQMGQPLLTRAWREGWARLAGNVFILVCAALLMAVNISPVIVLLVSGVFTVFLLAVIPLKRGPGADNPPVAKENIP